MSTALKVLLLEDRPEDAQLILLELRKAGYELNARRVENEADFLAALDPALDVILADYGLPQWNGLEALRAVKRAGLDVPVIIVSGSIGEETAVAAILEGATDYLLKDRLARLPLAVGRAMEERRFREERRIRAESLRRAEANYRGIFENAHEGIVQTTPDGIILTANVSLANIFGYASPADFQREVRTMASLYVDPSARERLMRQLQESGRVFNQEIQFRRRDGRLIWASVNIQVVNAGPGPGHLEGTLADITERRAAEEALRENEQRFVRQRNALIGLTGADHARRLGLTARFRQITEASARTLGVSRVSIWLFNPSRSAIRCMDLYETALDRHSAGMELLAADFPAYFQALARMDVIPVEEPRQDPRTKEFSESYLDPLGIMSMLDAGIRVHGLVEGVLCHEQTGQGRKWKADEHAFAAALSNLVSLALTDEQRQLAEEALRAAEQKTRTIIEHSSQIFYTHTPDNVLTYVSPQVREILGYEPAEAMRSWTEFLTDHPENATGLALTRTAIETGRPQRPYALELATKAGAKCWVEVRESPVVVDGRTVAIAGALTDITERKRAESALQESERFNRATLDALGAHLAVLDAEGVILATNRAWRDFAQANEADPVTLSEGVNYLGVCERAAQGGNEDAARTAAGIRAVAAGRQAEWFFEFPCHSPTEKRWYYCSIHRFPGEGPVRVVVAHENISEMKLAQSAQHETAERLRLAVQASHVGLWDWDIPSGRVIYSREGKRQLGYEDHEIGDSFEEWKSRAHPEDVPGVLAKLQRYLANPAGTHEAEVRVRHKDGSWRWIFVQGEIFRDAQGAPVRMMGCHLDITARRQADEALRQSEERYRHYFDSNPLPMWVHDEESHRIMAINESALRQYGYTREESLGLTMEQFHHAEDIAKLNAPLAEAPPDNRLPATLRHRRKDGSIVHVEMFTNALVFAGRPARLVLASDVTEKKQIQEKFLHAQRLESLGMLAAGIAHDLNNVLSPIMFAAPLLADSLTSPRDRKVLDTLMKCANRGSGLVKQILGFAGATTGEFQTLQVKHIARDVIGVIEETFPKSIRLDSNIPSDLWPIRGDATQIHQVLVNLCVNARDAMPKGGTLRLVVSNRALDALEAAAIPGSRAGAWVVIEVGDTGTGIAPEVLAHMWEPFYTTKGPGRGTGLGLTTVRGIVAAHLGFLTLDTQVGRGTTFRVFLPIAENGVSRAITTPPFASPRGHGELILVVDDDEAMRYTTAEILGAHGYRVITAVDGMETLAQFNVRSPEIALVVTDIDMPNLGGVALARALRQIRPNLPLLAMSGLTRDDAQEADVNVMQKLAGGFLLKPFNEEALLSAVHRLLAPAGSPATPSTSSSGPGTPAA